jgi:hypothetical protein
MLNKLIATGSGFGTVNPPPGVDRFAAGGDVKGVPIMLNIIFKSLILIASIMAVINLILAGYWFISASGDPKRIHDAWTKIWQSLLGLTIAAGTFLIAVVVGRILFGDANAILNFTIFTPN